MAFIFPLFISLSFFFIKNTSTVVCYCSPQLYFSFVFPFPNIALKFLLRACEIVWGWEHLSLDFRCQLIFVSLVQITLYHYYTFSYEALV